MYFATQPTNLRKSFDGLTSEIRRTLGYDPLGGHVFVFLNRRKNQVKLIVWTRGGFTIVHEKLERGTFTFPSRVSGDVKSIAIDVHGLAMLEGIDDSRAKSKPRWEPPPRVRVTIDDIHSRRAPHLLRAIVERSRCATWSTTPGGRSTFPRKRRRCADP